MKRRHSKASFSPGIQVLDCFSQIGLALEGEPGVAQDPGRQSEGVQLNF